MKGLFKHYVAQLKAYPNYTMPLYIVRDIKEGIHTLESAYTHFKISTKIRKKKSTDLSSSG